MYPQENRVNLKLNAATLVATQPNGDTLYKGHITTQMLGKIEVSTSLHSEPIKKSGDYGDYWIAGTVAISINGNNVDAPLYWKPDYPKVRNARLGDDKVTILNRNGEEVDVHRFQVAVWDSDEKGGSLLKLAKLSKEELASQSDKAFNLVFSEYVDENTEDDEVEFVGDAPTSDSGALPV